LKKSNAINIILKSCFRYHNFGFRMGFMFTRLL